MKAQMIQSRPVADQGTSAVAYDEVFARLSGWALDPAPFRELAADLDRQHERLQRLLRALDEAAASE